MTIKIPSRQVHLDFHTSEYINDIGKRFDKKEFQNALIAGHINSMTVFAKCHHGYCYYPTEVGTMHPNLNFDLTGAMIEACHEIGVKAPIYITLGWSAKDAEDNPSWVAKNKDGSVNDNDYDIKAKDDESKPESSWLNLCSAGDYQKHLYDITKEVCERYEQVDGLFFDIVFMFGRCYCDSCIEGMKNLGYDAENLKDVRTYYELKKYETLNGINRIIKAKHPNATIFYNGGAEMHLPQWHELNTHFELEDLPTAWGGYDKMPIRAKYFSRSGKDYLGMTGKFHLSWGEFGGYKTPEALKYECSALMTYGAKVSVGDQMHPLGFMDMETYKNIGYAYSYVESIEEYCFNATETSKLGVIISDNADINEAIAKLLLDCHFDFDIVYDIDDMMRLDTIIIPDEVQIDKEWSLALEKFIASGKSVLMFGGSCLNETNDDFSFNLNIDYLGKSEDDIDYLIVTDEIKNDMVTSPILCYESAHMVQGDGEVLAHIKRPYFNRTYEHYCSHANTPYSEEIANYPAAIKSGNVIYMAHCMARMYKEFGSVYHRRYFKNLLQMIYKKPVVSVDIPTAGRIRMTHQTEQNRYILHLLYSNPIQRGKVSVIEDLPIIANVSVKISVKKVIKRIYTAPQMNKIDCNKHNDNDCIEFICPEFSSHQIIVLEY